MKRSSIAGAEMSDGLIEGYASLFGVEDQGRDVVMRGAFAASVAARGAGGIRMLFQHDPAQPIGVWDEIREDARGLYVRGRIVTAAARGADLAALVEARALDGLSIGFRARRAVRDAATASRRLYDIDLWEISLVTFPMLPGARLLLSCAVRQAPRDFAMKAAMAAHSVPSHDPSKIATSFVRRDQTSIAAVYPAWPRLAASPSSSPGQPGRHTRPAAPPSPGAARARPGGGFLPGCGVLRPVGGAVGG